MLRFSLNDSLLVTVFLPGAILLSGIAWIALPSEWLSIAYLENSLPKQSGKELYGTGVLLTGLLAITALLAFCLAMFLGILLSVIIGYIEPNFLDARQAIRLKIGHPEEYQRQWQRYLDSLEKAHNSYVTKQVTAFHFQARSALALLILAVCILPSSTGSVPVFLVPVGFLFLAAFLCKAAVDDHLELAAFRQRRFGVQPDPTEKPEELLRSLVDIWCRRVEVRPLRLVLSALGEDGKAISESLVKARDALREATKLKEVLPSEKCMLCLAIAALSERIPEPPASEPIPTS